MFRRLPTCRDFSESPVTSVALVAERIPLIQGPLGGNALCGNLDSGSRRNASIYAILQQYEQLTGNALLMDSNLAANALPISISVPEPVLAASLCGYSSLSLG
jgi:hypothetical protein